MTVSRSEFAALCGLSRRTVNRWLDGELREALVGGQVDQHHPLAKWLIETGGEGRSPGGTDSGGGRGAPRPRASSPEGGTGGRRPPRGPAVRYQEPPVERPAPRRPSPPAPSPPPRQVATMRQQPPPREGGVGRVARGERMDRFVAPDTVPLPDGTLLTIEEIRDLPFGEVIDRWGWGPGFKEHLLALRALEEARDRRLRVDERRGGLISRELVRGHVIGYLDALSQRLLAETPRRLSGLLRAAPSQEEAESLALHELERLVRTSKEQAVAGIKKLHAEMQRQAEEEEDVPD